MSACVCMCAWSFPIASSYQLLLSERPGQIDVSSARPYDEPVITVPPSFRSKPIHLRWSIFFSIVNHASAHRTFMVPFYARSPY